MFIELYSKYISFDYWWDRISFKYPMNDIISSILTIINADNKGKKPDLPKDDSSRVYVCQN